MLWMHALELGQVFTHSIICCFIWNGIPSDYQKASMSSKSQGQTCWLIHMAFQLGGEWVYQNVEKEGYSCDSEKKNKRTADLVV